LTSVTVASSAMSETSLVVTVPGKVTSSSVLRRPKVQRCSQSSGVPARRTLDVDRSTSPAMRVAGVDGGVLLLLVADW
jgi:hypothetical protein